MLERPSTTAAAARTVGLDFIKKPKRKNSPIFSTKKEAFQAFKYYKNSNGNGHTLEANSFHKTHDNVKDEYPRSKGMIKKEEDIVFDLKYQLSHLKEEISKMAAHGGNNTRNGNFKNDEENKEEEPKANPSSNSKGKGTNKNKIKSSEKSKLLLSKNLKPELSMSKLNSIIDFNQAQPENRQLPPTNSTSTEELPNTPIITTRKAKEANSKSSLYTNKPHALNLNSKKKKIMKNTASLSSHSNTNTNYSTMTTEEGENYDLNPNTAKEQRKLEEEFEKASLKHRRTFDLKMAVHFDEYEMVEGKPKGKEGSTDGDRKDKDKEKNREKDKDREKDNNIKNKSKSKRQTEITAEASIENKGRKYYKKSETESGVQKLEQLEEEEELKNKEPSHHQQSQPIAEYIDNNNNEIDLQTEGSGSLNPSLKTVLSAESSKKSDNKKQPQSQQPAATLAVGAAYELKINKLSKQNKQQKTELEQLKEAFDKRGTELDELNIKLTETENELIKSQKNNQKLFKEIENELKEYKSKVIKTENELVDCQKSLAQKIQIENELKEYQNKMMKIESELIECQKKLAAKDCEVVELSKKLENVEAVLDKSFTEEENYKTLNMELNFNAKTLMERNEELEAEKLELTEKFNMVEAKLSDRDANLTKINCLFEVEKIETLNLMKKNSDLERKLQEEQQSKRQLCDNNLKLQERLKNSQSSAVTHSHHHHNNFLESNPSSVKSIPHPHSHSHSPSTKSIKELQTIIKLHEKSIQNYQKDMDFLENELKFANYTLQVSHNQKKAIEELNEIILIKQLSELNQKYKKRCR